MPGTRSCRRPRRARAAVPSRPCRTSASSPSASLRPVASTIRAIARSVMSLRTNVGQTALTRTPLPASSLATARVSPTAACLEAVYAQVYGRSDPPRRRGHRHDRAGPALAHPGHHRAHAQKRAGDVDVKVPAPGSQRRAIQARALGEARVVDEHVDGADLLERPRHGILVGDVAHGGLRAQTRERRLVAPQRDHLVAERGEPFDDGEPDALGAAGDDHRPAHAAITGASRSIWARRSG